MYGKLLIIKIIPLPSLKKKLYDYVHFKYPVLQMRALMYSNKALSTDPNLDLTFTKIPNTGTCHVTTPQVVLQEGGKHHKIHVYANKALQIKTILKAK